MGKSFSEQVATIEREVEGKREAARKQQERHERAENRRRLEEAKQSAEIVLVTASAAYVSVPLATRLYTGNGNVEQALKGFGIEPRSVDGYRVFPGRKLAAAFAGGALGRNNVNRLGICEVRSMDDLAELPEDPAKRAEIETGSGAKFFHQTYAAPMPNTAVGMGGRAYRPILEKFFKAAKGSLDGARSPGSRPARVAAWAAKDGDPAKGPADCLRDTFPLSIGYMAGGAVIWIRHAPELSGE